jgi:hypothetical protein
MKGRYLGAFLKEKCKAKFSKHFEFLCIYSLICYNISLTNWKKKPPKQKEWEKYTGFVIREFGTTKVGSDSIGVILFGIQDSLNKNLKEESSTPGKICKAESSNWPQDLVF